MYYILQLFVAYILAYVLKFWTDFCPESLGVDLYRGNN